MQFPPPGTVCRERTRNQARNCQTEATVVRKGGPQRRVKARQGLVSCRGQMRGAEGSACLRPRGEKGQLEMSWRQASPEHTALAGLPVQVHPRVPLQEGAPQGSLTSSSSLPPMGQDQHLGTQAILTKGKIRSDTEPGCNQEAPHETLGSGPPKPQGPTAALSACGGRIT